MLRPSGLKKMVKPAGMHLPVVSSLAPPDVAGNEIQFNNLGNTFTSGSARCPVRGGWVPSLCPTGWKNIYFAKWFLCVLSGSGFLAGFNAGEVATLVALFILFHSIFGASLNLHLCELHSHEQWLLCVNHPREAAAQRNWLKQTRPTGAF